MSLQFITLRDATGRASSLAIGMRGVNPKFLTVVGVLPHNSDIKPDTEEDRQLLIKWLQELPQGDQ